MSGWTLPPTGGPYLAPHEWDSIGKPPRPGPVYDPPTDFDMALLVAEAYRKADDLYHEAEELKDQARDLESEADDARDDAEKLAAKVGDDRLVKAIKSDPQKFKAEDDIRRWSEAAL